jgi:transposase
MNRKQRREMTRRIQSEDLSLAVIHPDAAGIDIGNESHYVAVPPTRDSQPVRRFGCTTAELKAMAVWLQQWAIRTIAMQSTGVYWVAVYDILEAAGFEVYLVNARETKNLPGRKSDVQGRKSRSSCRISQWFDSVATPNSQSSGSIVIRPEPWRRTLCPRRRARGEDRRPAKRTG